MGQRRSSDLAQRIKDRVSMGEAARLYGLEPNRAGFCRCPLHSGDNTASLKLYPDGKGWYCFGCHQGGTVIDLVKAMFGIDFRQACFRLDHDFNLGLTGTQPTAQESAAIQQRREEAALSAAQKREYQRQWERSIELTRKIDMLSDAVMALLQERDGVDQWLDTHQAWEKGGDGIRKP